MLTGHWLKVAAISLIALQAGLSSTLAQRRGLEAQVQTGTPPGLIKKVEPEYPPDVVLRHADGRGRFRLTVNPRSGEVDEVKIVKSCGYKILNELAAKALLQWRFQPGTRGPVEVPVEFYVHGGARILH
ncbi:MAG: energy transducer TonB [Verrucomicrobiota bacterium]|nr:energy transducer TonB [Verrucomicrobiota bacterium]